MASADRQAAKPIEGGIVILAGDVGGTNARLALMQPKGRRFEFLWQRTWPSREHATFVEIVAAARREFDRPVAAASFGIAGPVEDGRVHATNLPWDVDARQLAHVLGIERVSLLNDLEAHAWALATLGEADVTVLQAGDGDERGNATLIAAGTGLGEAGLFWNGSELLPFACEGGHASFAPTNEVQIDLWRWLAARFGHVSCERILSGPGIVNVYSFLSEWRGSENAEPGGFADRLALEGAAAITSTALDGTNVRAKAALDLFCDVLGGEAGNLALKTMATGGVWLGGGIAPRIAPILANGRFRAAFAAKGRLRPLLESIPIRLVLNDKTALIGAARHAAFELGAR